jgi:hypothetical protein
VVPEVRAPDLGRLSRPDPANGPAVAVRPTPRALAGRTVSGCSSSPASEVSAIEQKAGALLGCVPGQSLEPTDGGHSSAHSQPQIARNVDRAPKVTRHTDGQTV